MRPVGDLTGKRFGKLTVIERYPFEGKNSKWICKCNCRNKIIVSRPNLISNKTKSCGCLTNLYISDKHIKKIFINLPRNKKGCWEWNKSVSYDGYARIYYPFGSRKRIRIHRLSYQLFIGEIPRGKLVCHTCDNPKCVNPDHLWLGTNKENIHDMIKKGRHRHQQKKGVKNVAFKIMPR